MSSTPDDQPLLDVLAEAIQAVGVDDYREAPAITFDERCFPDAWAPTLVGVRTALRRMLGHVGLPDTPVRLDDARETIATEGLVSEPLSFIAIEDGTLCFDVYAIGGPRAMVTWMALEVVRAWAAFHGLGHVSRLSYRHDPADASAEPREQLDDVITTAIGVALGLGPLLAAGTIQTTKEERLSGNFVVGRWSVQTVGGLRPGDLARMLGIHAVAWQADADEQARLRASLDGDLARHFDDARSTHAAQADALHEVLGLPPSHAAPSRRPIDVDPLVEQDETALVQAEAALRERAQRYNEGHPVYRVAGPRTIMGGVLGGIPGTAIAAILAPQLPALSLVMGVVGAAAGSWWGRSNPLYRCSDRECGSLLAPDATVCPLCGGTVAGDIASAEERLAAEERDEDAKAAKDESGD